MTTNRLWTLGTVIVAIAVVVMGWLLVVAPTLGQAEAAQQQTRATDAQNTAQQASILRLKAESKRMPQNQAELKKLQEAIPATFALEGFLDQMEDAAASTGVVITSYTAGEAIAYGAAATGTAPSAGPSPSPAASSGTSASGTSASGTGALSGKLFTIPISLQLRGDLDQVLAFVRVAQENPRFFLVPNVGYKVSDGGGTLSGSVFVLREGSAKAAG